MAAPSGGDLRYRGTDSTKGTKNTVTKEQTIKGQRKFLGEYVCFLLLISYFIFFGIVSWGHRRLPTPKTTAEYTSGDLTFVEERAYRHLKNLVSFGPRVASSKANEEKAVNFILKELGRIKDTANHVHKLEIDVQRPEGSFSIDMWGGMAHYYKHVTNIVVRIGSARKIKGRHRALLVNAHFDSVNGSPGASDDAVSCALMLELLEVLSKMSDPMDHDLILLFNGAEENLLPASHGFITQHPWAKDIEAFINLEAAGAGGRELVFQTGPEHPWLVKAYSEHAPHPYAFTVAQEIFQAELIPSDTDFRIFRDFGHIPGIDIAFVSNGYVYHTKYDNMANIQRGSIQRAGDNVLHVVAHLLTTDTMEEGRRDDNQGKLVFFDVLGVFMFTVPTRFGAYMSWSLIIVAVGVVCLRRKEGFHGRPYIVSVLQALVVVVLSWLAGVVAIIFIGVIISSFNRQMFWYSNPGPILGIYASPVLYAIIRVQRKLGIKMRMNVADNTSNPWLAECVFFDAHVIVWALLLGAISFSGLASAYVPFIWLFFPLLGREIIWKYVKTYKEEVLSDYTVLSIYLMMLAAPIIMSFYMLWIGLEIFIPVTGRSGSEINPELFIGALTFLGVTVSTSYLTSLIHTFRTLKYTRAFLLGLFLVSVIAMFTSLGFPYSGDAMNPAPKRLYLQHTSRTFHDQFGDVKYDDSYLGLVAMDYLGVAPLFDHMPELRNASLATCEPDVPYCGLPYVVPVRSMLKNIWKLPAKHPGVQVHVEVQLVSRIEDRAKTNFTFSITGPSHMSVYISPRPNVIMIVWSISEVIARRSLDGGGGYTYFIYYGGGKKQDTWTLWFQLETGASHLDSDPILDIAVAGHYMTDFKYTPEIKTFMRRQPDWLETIPFISTYNAWTY